MPHTWEAEARGLLAIRELGAAAGVLLVWGWACACPLSWRRVVSSGDV